MDPRLLKLNFKDILPAIVSTVMPEVCACCGRRLEKSDRFLCKFCADDIPLTRYWLIERNMMADSYNERLSHWICRYEPYARAAALYFFSLDDGYSQISKELKYHRRFALGRHFACMLGRYLAESSLFSDVDLVVPVPLHWLRRWRRGYNQAEVIGLEVASALGCHCSTALLRRTRRTRTQTHLSTAAKSSNVQGAFAVSRSWQRHIADPPLHILLVDDVFTTGSTLSECHRALRTVFPSSVRISVATLACVRRG